MMVTDQNGFLLWLKQPSAKKKATLNNMWYMELENLFYRVLGPDNFVRGQGEGNFRDVNETDNTCKPCH